MREGQNMNASTNFTVLRKDEVGQIFKWVKGMESISVVGVSGAGKSNLFNQLLNPEIQKSYLGDSYQNYIIVRVDCHYLTDYSDRDIYSLILDQLETIDSLEIDYLVDKGQIQEITKNYEALLNAGNDTLKVQRFFKLALRSLLSLKEKHMVFLFDQFDDVFRDADPMIFRNLRGLRETYKYRIAFVTFTRDILPRIVELDSSREEFYELLESNLIWLKPYSKDDALSLVKRVSTRNQLTVDPHLVDVLIDLSGGHGGLLREALLITAGAKEDSLQENRIPEVLKSNPAIVLECKKIWNSISVEEKKYLANFVHGNASKDSSSIKWVLCEKGLLVEGKKDMHIFSDMFQAFVQQQEPLWDKYIYLDEAMHTVWVLGNPAPLLTAQEYRLFRLLYKRIGEVVSKDELVDAGWPNAKGGVSDEAIIVSMSRLRKKIEPDPDAPRFIENVREHGYRLNKD
jgi:hypothetical protein